MIIEEKKEEVENVESNVESVEATTEEQKHCDPFTIILVVILIFSILFNIILLCEIFEGVV